MLRQLVTALCTALGIAAIGVTAPVTAAGQSPAAKKPPTAAQKFVAKKLPWGDPDISGDFTTKDEANTPFERPDQGAGKRLEDITPEELAAAVKARRGRGTADSYTDRSISDRCISRRGTPANLMNPTLSGNSYQIIQTKGFVAIRYEMDPTRIIPIEGRGAARGHNSSALRSYGGDSVARWEGDTLVIDTTNFRANQNYRGANVNLHLVERFQRISPKLVNFTVRVDDATTWTRPWSFSFPLTEDDNEPIFEYGCHEGNLGLRNILSAGRSDDRKGIKSSDNVDQQADLQED